MPPINSELTTQNSEPVMARRAVTLVELTVAVAVMVVLFLAMVPLLRGIHNSWDTRQGNADMIQNGRILMDHLRTQLAKAKKIIQVSGSGVTNGYIVFTGNDDNTYRYDIAGSHYVEFGQTGSLADLAGPVSSLRFTCYDDGDLTTPITDGNAIRLVKVQAVLTNSVPMGQSRTWTTSVQLRCDIAPAQALVGWWRFDEDGGLTALDSSGNGYDGALTNMTGNERIAGILDKALSFDGNNNHVVLPIGSLIRSLQSITVATWVNFSNTGGSWQRIFDFGSDTTKYMFLCPQINSNGNMRFAITTGGSTAESILNAPSTLPTGWHHVAVVIDGTAMIMKLYQDGAVVANGYTARLPLDLGTTTNNWLGRSQYSANAYLSGSLDDFRIYNYVLSSTQIGDLFAVGDMVMHLPFDETSGTTAYDNVGTYNGTLVNGPTWTTGTWSGALSFDGTNDYVSAMRPVQDDFTIAVWVKTTSLAIGPLGYPTQWWDGEGLVDADIHGNHNDFGCSNNRGKFCFGTGDTHGGTERSVLSTSTLNDGNWHHVAATRNHSSGQMQVYVDGVQEAGAPGYTGSLNASGSDAYSLRIGGILDRDGTPNPDASRLLHGQLDDVRIYDRILTADQIALLLQ